MNNAIIESAPKLIPVLQDDKGFWANISIAVITLVAVLVALFQERIKDFFNKSELDMKINLQPPDCHQIELTDQRDGSVVSKSIYIRIKVTHTAGRAAQNAEIMLTNFWKVGKKGKKDTIKEFLPMNLVWSHFQPRRIEAKIPTGIFRHCDFGSFRPVGNGVFLLLDTMVQPNAVSNGVIPNLIHPGKYRFEVLLTGDNVKPTIKQWDLKFDNVWSDEEAVMLKNIKIKEVKSSL